MTKSCDILIVGGGIVGLATAFRILQSRPDLRLVRLEKESTLAKHQTGNNSGVIHSGLYYRPGSLKALNCMAGYRLLLNFCQDEGIPHEICGKVVVATNEKELPQLEMLYHRGIANGLEGIRWLTSQEISDVEPHCVGLRGIRVPQTGIVDYKAVAIRYGEKIREAGAEIFLSESVKDMVVNSSGVEVVSDHHTWSSKFLVVCAGLQSDRLALKSDPNLPVRIIPFRGEYYELKPEAHYLVRNLIYPVPDPAFPFLGVHFTRMIGGGVECGPNAVLAWGREAYKKTDFNWQDTWETLTWTGFQRVAFRYWRSGLDEIYRSWSKSAFVRALQRLIPSIQEKDLVPGGAGIRAQACHVNGQLLDDFDLRVHERVIHVCNAPSPAATASLAIGETLAQQVMERFD
ncbi:L-2-hydroxyglutarate oxidase [Cylindrospermopsis raciborskii UAM/DH-BiRr]|uniref:L-2-hydroxyglutarate oxidase n=1 Tax=Cylindrospermopsis raciborskii TaxID=77022 RepID=UPI00387A316A